VSSKVQDRKAPTFIYRVPDIETTDADGKPVRLTEIEVHVISDDDCVSGIARSIHGAFKEIR
jgi:hypothetical protein